LLSLCVLREGQFVVAECAGSGRRRDDADEWHDATVSGAFSEELRGVEMSKVTESLCGDKLTVRFSRHYARRLHKVAKSDW